MMKCHANKLITSLLERANVVIREPQKVTEKVTRLIEGGTNKLHVVADYDMTLTKYLADGKPNVISHAALSLTDHVSDSFKQRVNELHKEYLPYQISATLDYQTKYQKMDECWNRYNQVYIDEKITKDHLSTALSTLNIQFRSKLDNFINQLETHTIPMTVISAGITDVITELLTQHHLITSHIHVASNAMIYSPTPPHHCIDFTSPPLHILNKDKVTLQNPIYAARLPNRSHLILLGDNVNDINMSHSFHPQLTLTVGFLNHDTDRHLDNYTTTYDIVITDDGDFAPVVDLLEAIIASSSSTPP